MNVNPAALKKNLRKFKRLTGFSLVEMLVVVTLISIAIIPLFVSYRTSRTNQALASSVEQVANQTRSAHIFAREARDKKSWGIKSVSNDKYILYSISGGVETEEQLYYLEPGAHFESDFSILFSIGTGETSSDTTINLIADNGSKTSVLVVKTGVVEVLQPS